MHHEIGNAAGRIWEALNSEGALTTERLKKATKLNDKLMHQAIGWLARENKLNFVKKGKYVNIILNPNI